MTPTFYLEAQLDHTYPVTLHEANIELQKVFSDGLIESLMLNLDLCTSDVYEPCFPRYLVSIKAVHYTTSNDAAVYHETKDCQIVINSYKMRHDDDEMGELVEDLISTHPKLLPAESFEDTWERLVFDRGIKEELIQLATNSLHFRTLNRLILLSGRPGTGKTTLAQALAQRLSIRLNGTFSETFLLHLRAATLLSQFFGQSAKQIHQIFESIAHLSSTNPTTLYVLVIDEIESLAGSRSKANAQGEVQDAVRATNELLVGFDTIKNRRNVFIICTSNLLDSLDEAFTDRCSLKIVVPPPGASARYAILRNSMGMLVEDEIITVSEHDVLPKYDDAVARHEGEYDNTGIRLRALADNLSGTDGNSISARSLGQLPELALGTYLHPGETCTLSKAVNLMLRFVRDNAIAKVEPIVVTELRALGDSTRAPPTDTQTLKRKIKEDGHDEHNCPCCTKRAKLMDAPPSDDTTRDVISLEVARQLVPMIEQMEKRVLEELQAAGAGLPKPPQQARPLEEIGVAARNSRTMKPEKESEPVPWLRVKSQAQAPSITNTIEPSTEQMLLDESPRRPIQQRKKTGDLVEKIETAQRHGDGH